MGKGHCQHGCYPVDKRWHDGSLTDGDGNSIDSIWDLREFIRENGGGVEGARAAEARLDEDQPRDEPYVLPNPDEQDPIDEKKKGRSISISDIGQGFDLGAHLQIVDHLVTYYRYEDPFKVTDWVQTTPQSQVHDEYVQRRQQAEQQVNRVLSNLTDLIEQKQLLEHDLRRLEERKEHFEAAEEDKGAAGGYEDELKADFVDLVDQHTGRHSILQMQQNNVFPSITADFYKMRGLDDLTEGGALADLPENEKAVLRKKWKLYEQWKGQFRRAVESRYQDVQQRLNSVQTSIEQTKEWMRPYVRDIKRIQPSDNDWAQQMGVEHELGGYIPFGTSTAYRMMKIISKMDRSPGQKSDKYHDVVVFKPLHYMGAGFDQPQAAGQGLVIYKMMFKEYLVCDHVWNEVFKPQIDAKKNEVDEYIKRYVGEMTDIDADGERLRDRYGDGLTDDEEERIAEAETEEELDQIEADIIDRMRPGWFDRRKERLKEFLGMTDDFYHEDPQELRRELLGPYFPTQFYLDYKYDNDLYVMK